MEFSVSIEENCLFFFFQFLNNYISKDLQTGWALTLSDVCG